MTEGCWTTWPGSPTPSGRIMNHVPGLSLSLAAADGTALATTRSAGWMATSTTRYAAPPGSKTFGAISIFLQAAYAIAPGHKVPAACFHPRPDVESYLLNLVRRPAPFIFDRATKSVIRGCFQQRRKQIGSLLRHLVPPATAAAWLEHLAAAGLSALSRPEDIPVAVWQHLVVPPATAA